MPEFSHMSGGQAIESAASRATDPKQFDFPPFVTRKRDCQLSFAGILTTARVYIAKHEKETEVEANRIIPDVYNLCASLQWAIAKHVCLRTQRAMEYIDQMNLIPQEKRTLVRKSPLSLISNPAILHTCFRACR